jgi:ATP-dependent RNA helicase DDX31/DBP7
MTKERSFLKAFLIRKSVKYLRKIAFLISTDVASRGLDFPVVDIIVHYDINPDKKDYVNRMGRTARLDHKGHSVLFLMQNEHKLMETCFKEFQIKNLENKKILSGFLNKFNKEIFKKSKEEKENIEYIEALNKFKDVKEDKQLDSDSFYEYARSAIDLIRKSIKNFIFKDRENLILARSAFNTSIKAYTTFFKFQKDVFNAKALNLPRFV